VWRDGGQTVGKGVWRDGGTAIEGTELVGTAGTSLIDKRGGTKGRSLGRGGVAGRRANHQEGSVAGWRANHRKGSVARRRACF